MIIFGIVAAILTVVALVILLPPLLRQHEKDDVSRQGLNVTVYRDQMQELDNDLTNGLISQEGFDQAKQEIESSLLKDVAVPDDKVKTAAGSPLRRLSLLYFCRCLLVFSILNWAHRNR